MTINLFDLPVATAAYIDNEVDVVVRRVTANLEPGEEGTYTVRVTNAAAPSGVRLTELSLHLTVPPSTVALLKPPGAALLNPPPWSHGSASTVSSHRSGTTTSAWWSTSMANGDPLHDVDRIASVLQGHVGGTPRGCYGTREHGIGPA